MIRHARPWWTDELGQLKETASAFFTREVGAHREKWDAQQQVDREVWSKAGGLGLLCASVPECYGGGGGTYAHEAVLLEEQARAGDTAFGNFVHSVIVAHYILNHGTEEQKLRWLPDMATGRRVGAVAMTEPETGSDLRAIRTTARRDGDDYVIDGAKTFISNGMLSDLIVLACKTSGPDGKPSRISLVVVETDDEPAGFSRGRVLEKIGQHGQDTAELYFEGLRVPATNLLGGTEGNGFGQLTAELPRERLVAAIIGAAAMEEMVAQTIAYTRERSAFGTKILDFQNTRFRLAECATETTIARIFVDECITRTLDGTLDNETAAMAKWWVTEKQNRVLDACLQLHGGYGYMREYAISRAWVDARVQMIAAGTNEIMKEIIGRSL